GADEKKPGEKPAPPKVPIDLEGIAERLERVPVPAGNYTELRANDKALFWLNRPAGEMRRSLQGVSIGPDAGEPKTVADGVTDYELSQDGKKLLLVRQAGPRPRG